jgi:sugar phosphate isomerase/epimerase
MTMKKPVAVQMYTLREESAKDFVGTLKKVSEIGYDGVEFAGFGGLPALELRQILQDLDLRVAGSHIPLKTLEEDLEQVIEYQNQLGGKHVVCPSMPVERRGKTEEYRKLARFLNEAGERCKAHGLTLSYHNHDFDLLGFDGRPGLKVLLEETNPEWVKMEFDVFWLQKAGEDPAEWIRQAKGRTPLVHLKDMTTDEEQTFAELGTGGVDIPRILKRGEEANVEWWIVEQDRCSRSPFESIQISFHYLKENEWIRTK